MSLDNPEPHVSVPLHDILPLVSMVSKAGMSMSDILVPLGLPDNLFACPDTEKIRLSDYFRILARLTKVAGDETFHFTSRRLMPGSTDLIMSSALGSANMLGAMKAIAKSNNLLHGEDYNRVEKSGKHLHYIIDDHEISYALDNSMYNYATMEAVTLYIFGMLAFISDRCSVSLLREVHSRRPQYDPERDLLSCLGVPVHYNAPNYALSYDESLATLPVATTSADTHISKKVAEIVIAIVDSSDAQPGQNRSASHLVKQQLKQGIVDQQEVARHCNMSVATLKRHLRREGTSFRMLRDRVRNDSAKLMFTKGYNASEVAELLGYSDSRSFYRAFKSWNGVSPHTYIQETQKHSGNLDAPALRAISTSNTTGN